MPKYEGICPQLREVDVYTDCPFDCVYCVGKERRKETGIPEGQVEKLLREPKNEVPVYASPWTDPYPPEEATSLKTRALLEKLSGLGQSFFVITRSTLVERDKDLFQNRENAFIAVSINTLEDSISAITEPKAPKPSEKVKMVENLLLDPTVKVVVRVDPIIPGLTDGESLKRTIAWLGSVKPYAACFETLRVDKYIAKRLGSVLPDETFEKIMSYYVEPEKEPVHPDLEWRYNIFKDAARTLEENGVRASFCRASLPKPVTKWDCRGGFGK